MIFDKGQNHIYAAGQFVAENGESIIEKYDLNTKSTKPEIIKGVKGAFVKMHFADNKIWILDESGKSIKTIENGKSTNLYTSEVKINDFVVDETKPYIWLAADNGDLYRLDKNGENDTIMYQNSKTITAITSKYNFLVIGDVSGGVRLFFDYDFSNSNPMTGHIGGIDELKISENGAAMLSAGKDKTVRIWNLSEITQAPIVLADHADWVWSTDFSANNEWIFSVSEDGMVHVWPYSIDLMGNQLCDELDRNMNTTEWATYVGSDLPYEKTCENLEKLSDATN